MVMRARFSGGLQIFEELCEHCGEPIRDIHVSEITFKAENDPRTVRISGSAGNVFELKDRRGRISETSESFKRKQLLTDQEARDGFNARSLKYGLRPEAMCSESIDIEAGVTQSFCYRVAANPADRRFEKIVGGRTLSSSFSRAAKTDNTGSRAGVDRHGNVVKLNRYKRINMSTGAAETSEKYARNSPYETVWFRSLRDRNDEQYLIRGAQAVAGFVRTYGEEVRDMTVVARFRNRTEFITAVNRYVNTRAGERSLR